MRTGESGTATDFTTAIGEAGVRAYGTFSRTAAGGACSS
jgi:hypothetical protein